MKATYKQIEKALNNTYKLGEDGSYELCGAIKQFEDLATHTVCTEVKKSTHFFNKSDWKKVYREIKKLLK